MNTLTNYYRLLDNNKTLDDDNFDYINFLESLRYTKNAIIFNYTINNLIENNIKFDITKGFNYLSNDNDIKYFNKIEIIVYSDINIFKNLIQSYFNILNYKDNIFILKIKK